MKKQLLISLVTALAFASSARAEVKPNALFSDNAVLQQNASVPVWGTAKEGEKVTVTLDGQAETTVAKGGKWMVRLKPHKAGGPFTLTIAGENTVTVNNVLVGEVWVCSGQSNMAFGFAGCANAATETPLANYPKLRRFYVNNGGALTPQTELQKGEWVECSPATVGGFSAVGYFFGRDIHKATGAPVGMIHSSVGGTPAQAWTSLAGLEKDPELHGYVEAVRKMEADRDAAAAKYPQELAAFPAKLKEWEETVEKPYQQALKDWKSETEKSKAAGKPLPPMPKPATPKPWPPALPGLVNARAGFPATLFNGKIAPLIPYAIKGVIWYQGESNSGAGKEYRTLFLRMISDWREKWGEGDFPFLFVQIAPCNRMMPELREAQFLTWKKTPNTAMAVTTDVGEANDIHPKQKEPVGARLALAARALAYGEKIEYSGPEYDSFKVDQNRVVLSFKHVGGGLVAKDGPLKGFTIAGPPPPPSRGAVHPSIFVPAKAEIKGDTVVVSSDQVPLPVAVRYGWTDVPDGNLWNKEGLPASPFRTDP